MREKSQHPTISKLERQIKGKFQPRIPKSKKIEQEFGPGKVDLLICKKCEAVYWYKSWHHKLDDWPKFKKEDYGADIKFVLCPACQMIKDKKYEGEVILENVPKDLKNEIKKLIENFGKRAFEKDPLDRIISIKEEKVKRVSAKRKRGAISRKEFKNLVDLRVLTTENQLAQRLAKKIKETFGKKLPILISHSHIEDVFRIKIKFS
jgi:uncharacterized CHY-type Zn-finger protein